MGDNFKMNRSKNSWDVFRGRDPTKYPFFGFGGSSRRPDKSYIVYGGSGTSTSMIYNKIAVDCATINIRHVRLNDKEKYKETINSSLNQALSLSANLDQTGRALIIDAVESMLEEGCVALVPTITEGDPNNTESFKVEEIRVARIVEWMPKHVSVEVYNQDTGNKEILTVSKRYTAIIENPFYTTMNTQNSTASRLSRVLSKLDRVNDEYNPQKLDLIVQLPHTLKTPAKRKYAEERRKEIIEQLSDSVYGIAYTDGTEKVIQLNRSLENNLWTQAKDLTEELYNQLGMSKGIFDGSADEATLLNYYNRTIEPILSAITEEMERKWLSPTARSQYQAIRFFRDPFKLVPVKELAEISDKLSRNEIMSSNEIRSVIGLKPDPNPKSDMLLNSNLNQSNEQLAAYGLDMSGSKTDMEKNEVTNETVDTFILSERVGNMTI